MSFLQELENSKKNTKTVDKTPKQLWESCFKYFKYFVSILQKDKDSFDAKFNFTFLNVKADSQITGPYEISRASINNELTLEVKMLTIIKKNINIKRKNKRSAELLQSKLNKDNIVSVVKKDKNEQYFIEVSKNIPSLFQLKLVDNKDFYILYKNICSSAHKSIKLSPDDINEKSMDNIAKYIIGQNPSLYTETIGEDEISQIREKIALEKQKKELREQEIQAKIKKQQELEAIKKANSLQQRSKRYVISKTNQLKSLMMDKIKQIKSKIQEKV